MQLRKFMALSVVIFILLTMLTIPALAETVNTNACETSDSICEQLKEIYGEDTVVEYAMEATDVCIYEIVVLIEGEETTIFVSVEPVTESPEVAPPDIDSPSMGGSSIADTEALKQLESQYLELVPNTSTDDILNWATTKGNEIIYVLQIFCQPFAIIIFIIAAFMTLIGCIGKSDMVGKGAWGMVLSVIVYAAVLYAPVILQTFVGWVAS